LLIETFLYALIGQIPLLAAAVILSLVGWRRLGVHNRKAALWLIAGMTAFAARWILGALSVAYSNVLMVQIRERGGERSDIAPTLTVFSLLLGLLLIFSLICFLMATISGRRHPDPTVATSNGTLHQPS
jgi:hypothetical protein